MATVVIGNEQERQTDGPVVVVHSLPYNPETGHSETMAVQVTDDGVILKFYEDGELAGTWANTWDEIIEVMP